MGMINCRADLKPYQAMQDSYAPAIGPVSTLVSPADTMQTMGASKAVVRGGLAPQGQHQKMSGPKFDM